MSFLSSFQQLIEVWDFCSHKRHQWKGFVSFLKEFVLKEKNRMPNRVHLIHYIPIVGGYMVDVYEMGIYEWPLTSLRYLLISTLIVIC